MRVRPIIKLGVPSLRQRSVEVTDPVAPEVKQIIKELKQAMIAYGGVGIAAPQIGINQRILMFGFEKSQRYPNEQAVPFTVLINPTVTLLGTQTVEGWEGCLSLPGLRGKVSRHYQVSYSGWNEQGEKIERTVKGFHARVVQHEYDHLDGILYIDRLLNFDDFGFEEALGARIFHPR